MTLRAVKHNTPVDQRIHDIVDDKIAPIIATVEEIKTQLGEVKSDTAIIVSAVAGATRLGVFAKTHGPRLFAFAIGVLVTGGYLNPNMAKQIIDLFH